MLSFVKPFWLKHLLADHFVNSFFNSTKKGTGEKFYEKFLSREWEKCDDGPLVERKKPGICQADYLALLLLVFEGYLGVYRLDEFVELIKTPASSEMRKRIVTYGDYCEEHLTNPNKLADNVNCANLNMPVAKRLIHKYYFNGINVNYDLYMFYRTEIKYFYHAVSAPHTKMVWLTVTFPYSFRQN